MNVYAGLAYMQDVREVTNLEVPDYKAAQFLSDAGGAAGLFLGMRLVLLLILWNSIVCMTFMHNLVILLP